MHDNYQNMCSDSIREVFSMLNERIGFVRLNEISPGLGNSVISLLEIVVPLRSDIAVTAVIHNHEVESVRVHHVGKQDKYLAVINKKGIVIDESIRDNGHGSKIKINADFVTSLFKNVCNIIDGNMAKGLTIRPRPLILAPLWTEGEKEEFADVDVLSAANMFQYVVILGAPGSGKTTTAKAIATAHFYAFINSLQQKDVSYIGLWNDNDNLPIYIELKSMVSDKKFPKIDDKNRNPNVDFFKEYIKNNLYNENDVVMEYVTKKLQIGEAVLILDGLDEVPIPNIKEDAIELRHNQLQNLIRSVKTLFPKIKIIVTSRPAGYSGWTLNGFEVIHIRPLSSHEAAQLAYSYYIAAGEEESESKILTEKLIVEIERLPQKIREYPLFICLLASLYRDKGGEFPAKRGGLLKVSLDTLLGPWTMKRHNGESLQNILNCTPDVLLDCLARISFRAMSEIGIHGNTDTPDVPISMALEEFYLLGDHINPTQVLNYIMNQAGIWTSPAQKKLRFVHRLFQEYLAAWAISQKDDCIGEMANLVIENPVLWTEVSLLFADILSNKKQNGELFLFIEQLLNRFTESCDPPAIIALVASVIVDEEFHLLSASIKKSASITSCINKLMECLSNKELNLTGKQRNLLGLALNELGDPRIGVAVDENNLPVFCWERIPAGDYFMGTDESAKEIVSAICGKSCWNFDREYPEHKVHINSFDMSSYPVTSIQFKSFILADDGYANDEWWTEDGLIWRDNNEPPATNLPDNCPQNCVTWYEAIAFCNWCSAKTNSKIRLPSEAEWEYAAKRCTKRQFVWGDECNETYANVNNTGIGNVSPVGCFPIKSNDSPDNQLFDMNGNLWEWCSSIVEKSNGDLYSYPYNAYDGREDLAGGDEYFRATRGGYYGGEWMYARNSYRGRDLPSLRAERQGFRVVRANE